MLLRHERDNQVERERAGRDVRLLEEIYTRGTSKRAPSGLYERMEYTDE